MTLEEASIAIRALEPIFHRPEHGTTREDFDRMMDADYWEVGASGNRYTREFILDVLVRRQADAQPAGVLVVTDFACRQLDGETYLATYTLEQPQQRISRRSTVWQHTQDGWKAIYHQGTLVTGL